MTPEQINIAIARHLGDIIVNGSWTTEEIIACGAIRDIRNYAGSLDAMQSAIMTLTDAQFHRYTLEISNLGWRLFPHQTDDAAYKQRLRVCFAPSAEQMAEAFLRTLELW